MKIMIHIEEGVTGEFTTVGGSDAINRITRFERRGYDLKSLAPVPTGENKYAAYTVDGKQVWQVLVAYKGVNYWLELPTMVSASAPSSITIDALQAG